MTTYGILLVDTSWANQDSVQIEKATYLRYKDQLIEGAEALIYLREPVDAIVAAAELTGSVTATDNEPEDPVFSPENLQLGREIHREEQETAIHPSQQMEKTFCVSLNITRLKGQTEEIPLNRLKVLLGSDFSVYDETWIPLSETHYTTIVAQWGT